MDDFDQKVFLMEIEAQCTYALQAIQNLNMAIGGMHATGVDHQRMKFLFRETFRSLHSFLTHTSNISKMIWPIDSKKHRDIRNARAAHLKTLLKIDDENPIKSRELRDHLEHYDERLDHWAQTSTHKNIAADNIGDWEAIQGLDSGDFMRWYDPADKSFRFRGVRYDINELFLAVQALHQKIPADLKH
ncbi:hypothetical protein [Chromobacterium violaceum]|uniref:hypothetical protein n=1 Tax=Chromobacterium violaceum TaxID=536 RepID=UPI003CEDB597